MAEKTDTKRGKKSVAAESAATPEVATGCGKGRGEGTQTGGTDFEGSRNPQVDKRSEKKTAAGKRFFDEIAKIAGETFLRIPADRLYFTSDRQGFRDRRDAENHAAKTGSDIFELSR